jgi:hypothetical protein
MVATACGGGEDVPVAICVDALRPVPSALDPPQALKAAIDMAASSAALS